MKIFAFIFYLASWISPDIENYDCHSSSIVETAPSQLCVVWKAGHGTGKSNLDLTNVGVWASLFDGSWSPPQEIVTAPGSVCWNPVLCKNGAGELLLFYRMGATPRCAVSFLKRSSDEGHTWSAEEILPAGIVGPTLHKPIFTPKGTLISPSSMATGEPDDAFKATACWIEMYADNHWKKVGPLELAHRKFGVIEPALFYDREGNLRMLCRDRALRIQEKGYIWMAISKDNGLTWSDFKSTQLPNPDSGIEVVDLGAGKILLIYNHSHTDRHPLNWSLSLDGGDTWLPPELLDTTGEFPSAIQCADGSIHITYARTRGKQRGIKHTVIHASCLR
jgi:predicted neuraminidase